MVPSQGSRPSAAPRGRQRGLTLLELLVVLSIAAMATAMAALALRDQGQQALQREGERLIALLEGQRAWSRSSGQPVRWVAVEGGFVFQGRVPARPPERWLSEGVQVQWPQVGAERALVLGPEPILAAQSVVLRLREQQLRLSTDGLAPFQVQRP
jgi:general secretion pathway protein H